MADAVQSRAPRWRWAYAAAWAVAFAVALSTDAVVAEWAQNSGVARAVQHARWAAWVKFPGTLWFTVAVVAILVAARQVRWRGAVLVVAVVAASGLNVVVKWCVGRHRPFKEPEVILGPYVTHPFAGGLRGLFDEKNLSFPSGHACTAWALAAGLAVVRPRGAWAVMVLALATGVERVLENAHYCSDVVAAIGFSTLLAWACGRSMLGAPPAGGPGFDVVQNSPGMPSRFGESGTVRYRRRPCACSSSRRFWSPSP